MIDIQIQMYFEQIRTYEETITLFIRKISFQISIQMVQVLGQHEPCIIHLHIRD